MFKSPACLLTALMLVPMSGLAVAQSASDQRLEDALNKLAQQASRAPAVTPAPADIHGVFRFVVVINLPPNPDFSGGLFCHAGASQFSTTSNSSFRDVPATLVAASSYRCIVKVPYHWQSADSTSLIFPAVTVYSLQVTHSLSDANDYASHGLQPQPLPADGTTTNFTVDLDM